MTDTQSRPTAGDDAYRRVAGRKVGGRRRRRGELLLAPASIAVVGASSDPSRVGGRALAFLKARYRGRLDVVRPGGGTVQGILARATLDEIGEAPELALIALGPEDTVASLRDCAAFGVGAAAVFGAGFAETGASGRELQERIREIADTSAMRIYGPNCLGFVNVPGDVRATFFEGGGDEYRAGPVALVSQSGAFGAALFKAGHREGLDISYFVSTGNEVDVTAEEVLSTLVEKDDVTLLLYIAETFREPNRLAGLARRARDLGKPILVMKAGATAAGARAALTHTGSMARSDRLVDAFLRDLGVIRARTVSEMLAGARALATGRRTSGRRVGIVTTSGGAGVVLSDEAVAAGLEVPELGAADRAPLEALMPRFASAVNPIDCTGQVVNDLATYGRLLSAAARTRAFDMVCIAGMPDHPRPEWLDAATGAARVTKKPVLAWAAGPEMAAALSLRGIPTFGEPGSLMSAAAALAAFGRPPAAVSAPAAVDRRRRAARRHIAQAVVAGDHGRGLMLEPDARRLFAIYDVAGPAEAVVASAPEAVEAAGRIGWPVALKAVAERYAHKSQAGAVRLDLAGEAELRRAWREMARRLPGVRCWLIQAMAPRGIELAVGLVRDPSLGAFVSLSLGGILVEVLDQPELATVPLDPTTALSMVDRLCGGRLVASDRGLTANARKAVAGLVVTVSAMACELPELHEIDLNPVIATRDGIALVDALAVIVPSAGPGAALQPTSTERRRRENAQTQASGGSADRRGRAQPRPHDK